MDRDNGLGMHYIPYQVYLDIRDEIMIGLEEQFPMEGQQSMEF